MEAARELAVGGLADRAPAPEESEVSVSASTLPVVVEVDLDRSRRGLASQLAADLEGRSVLLRTLDALRAARTLAEPTILVHRSQAEQLSELSPELRSCDIHVHECPDIGGRGRLRRGRRWGKEGWRGGLGDAYFTCEAGNPHALAELADARGWRALALAPACAPFLAAEVVDEIAGHYLAQRFGTPFYLSSAPPGLAVDIFHRDGLARLCERRASLAAIYPFRPGAADCDPQLHKAIHHFAETVSGARVRLCVDGVAALGRARALWAKRGDGTWESLRPVLEAWPDDLLGEVPEEVVLELAGDGAGGRPARSQRMAPALLPEGLFEGLVDALTARDDALLTLGGGYADPVRDPQLIEKLALARQRGVFGLHVETTGAAVDAAAAERLAAAELDVVTVALDAPTAELAEGLASRRDHDARLAGLGALADACATQAAPPFLVVTLPLEERVAHHLETFFDEWFERVDRILVRGFDDERGAPRPGALGVFAPPERTPCERLFGQLRVEAAGGVPLCARDPDASTPLGTLRTHSLGDVWRGASLRRARAAHLAGRWADFGHCGSCVSWCRFD